MIPSITGGAGAKFVGRAGAFRNDSRQIPHADLHAVWMSGPEDIFAAGGEFTALARGVVGHYGGTIPSTLQ